MMRGHVLIAMTLVHLCGVLCAAEPDAIVEAKLATQGRIWQGQRVSINCTVKTPDTFASALSFDLPSVGGVILVPPQGSPVLGTEDVGDDSFTTQTYELNAYIQQSGTVTIPPFSIRFDSSAGFGKPVQSRTVITTPISMTVERPPGTESLAVILTTAQLNVSETWKPDPAAGPVTVGAALTRTIRIDAANLPGIVLPSIRDTLPDGLRGYQNEPQLNDEEQRGDLLGHRVETTTIVCERPGHYELPSLTVSWWNPEESRLHRSSLPAHAITVNSVPPNPDGMPAQVQPSGKSGYRMWPLILLLVSATVFCGLWASKLQERIQASIKKVMNSEHYAFRKALHAAHLGEPRVVYRAILAWKAKSDTTVAEGEYLHPSHFSDDAELFQEWQLLERMAFGKPETSRVDRWSPQHLITSLKRYRSRLRRRGGLKGSSHQLPEMNPSSSSAR